MKILHAMPPAAGGMLRHAECLIVGLDIERYSHYCAAAPGAGLEAIESRSPGRCLPLPLGDRASLLSLPRCVWMLARAARSLQPDLIHGHGYRGMVLAALSSRLSGRPFVFTAHTLPGELGERFWRAARPLPARARGVVCVSQAIVGDLTKALGGSMPRVTRVVYNGIDPGPVPGPRIPLPPDVGGPGRRPVVVCAARLAPQKGVEVLVDAWFRLASRYPDGLLVIAGDGPLLVELERRAAVSGIIGSVRFAGFRTDVRDLLRAADAAAIPSLTEGQSVFALEAMAMGAPVVASRTGGLPEIVRHEETGLLVPPGDPEALQSALRRLLEEKEIARKLAVKARAFVETEMIIERMLARMDLFYRECV